MDKEVFQECNELVKKADKLLRKLEKSSKVLTQHVQTSILTFNIFKDEKNGDSKSLEFE